jgi:hypothetical protein
VWSAGCPDEVPSSREKEYVSVVKDIEEGF